MGRMRCYFPSEPLRIETQDAASNGEPQRWSEVIPEVVERMQPHGADELEQAAKRFRDDYPGEIRRQKGKGNIVKQSDALYTCTEFLQFLAWKKAREQEAGRTQDGGNPVPVRDCATNYSASLLEHRGPSEAEQFVAGARPYLGQDIAKVARELRSERTEQAVARTYDATALQVMSDEGWAASHNAAGERMRDGEK